MNGQLPVLSSLSAPAPVPASAASAPAEGERGRCCPVSAGLQPINCPVRMERAAGSPLPAGAGTSGGEARCVRCSAVGGKLGLPLGRQKAAGAAAAGTTESCGVLQ